jgi:hypothetical protein
LKNHEGFPPEITQDDLNRFNSTLPFGNDYHIKLAYKMKHQLQDHPTRDAKKEHDKSIQSMNRMQQQRLDAKQAKERLIEEWISKH